VEWRTQDTLQLQWLAPESDGGARVEEYIVERKEVGKKSWKQVIYFLFNGYVALY